MLAHMERVTRLVFTPFIDQNISANSLTSSTRARPSSRCKSCLHALAFIIILWVSSCVFGIVFKVVTFDEVAPNNANFSFYFLCLFFFFCRISCNLHCCIYIPFFFSEPEQNIHLPNDREGMVECWLRDRICRKEYHNGPTHLQENCQI